MNIAPCPYHREQNPPCVLVDVTDTLGSSERVHTTPTNDGHVVVSQPPLHTNAVAYGDRIVTDHLDDHLIPTVVSPGPYLGAFGRLRKKGKALRVLGQLQAMGFVVAWDNEYFGVAFPRNRPDLGDRLLELHASGPLHLDSRFIDKFVDFLRTQRGAHVG